MTRTRRCALLAVAVVALATITGWLVPLFAADTTISQFDVANQVSRTVRLKDNTDGTYSLAHWNTGDGTHFMPSMDAVGRRGYVSLTDGTNTSPTGDAPARALNVIQALPGTVTSGTSTGAAQVNTCSLASQTGKTNYVSGFTVTGGGATSASAITVTLSDGTRTLNFMLNVPAGVSVPSTPLIVNFPQPIPASAVTTAWTLTVPSFGSGNTAASANIWGYYQ